MTTEIKKGDTHDNVSWLRASHSPLRDKRGEKLIHFLQEHIYFLPQGSWLDLGCSDGQTLHLAAKRGAIAPKGHFAIDISPSMISRARSNYPGLARFMLADFFDIPLPEESLAGIISNSSLQWAQRQGGLAAVLQEARRLLPLGAPLALAIPGPALDSELLVSYKKVYQENPAWHEKGEAILDPLSGPTLDLLLQEVQRASFLPLFSEMTLESFSYEKSEEYLAEIESSLRPIFLTPFQKKQRARAWREISLDFLEKSPSPYFHQSLLTYLIARASPIL